MCVNANDDKAPGNTITVDSNMNNINKFILVANNKDPSKGMTCNN
jgi:hypothetical protein